jgi:hypothetical protein
MTSFWLGQLGRTKWKGHIFSFLFYGRQVIKSLGKWPRFSKALSNTLASTYPKGNTSSALKGNRLCVPSQPLRPTGKSENFGEPQVSVKSGSLTTPS